MRDEERREGPPTSDAGGGRMYVLRIWLDGAFQGAGWRASVHQGSAAQRHFVTVDDLLLFLYAECVRREA